MTSPTLDTYYNRMTSSLGDKKRVLDYVKGNNILDVGCGSGDLLNVLLDDMDKNAYGLDPAEESVERNKYSKRVLTAYADEADALHNEFYDTIICSSVLHEVFSYGNRTGERGRTHSLVSALRSFHKALRPGGRLIVRDGVSPGFVGSAGMFFLDSPERVEEFLAASPFANPSKPLDRAIALHRHSGNIFLGTPSSLMEFVFTYTWGPESFEREVQEFYGVFTLEDYKNFAQEQGFKPIEFYAYKQGGYEKHLNNKVKFFDMEFPNTNAIWVYEK